MVIADICQRHALFVERYLPLPDVAQLMRYYSVSAFVVVDYRSGKRFPVGMVTDHDLVVTSIAGKVKPESLCAGDAMHPHAVEVEESSELWPAIRRMLSGGVRRAPVVGQDGRLVGLVAMDDLLLAAETPSRHPSNQTAR